VITNATSLVGSKRYRASILPLSTVLIELYSISTVFTACYVNGAIEMHVFDSVGDARYRTLPECYLGNNAMYQHLRAGCMLVYCRMKQSIGVRSTVDSV
jgi:hypothetical protein